MPAGLVVKKGSASLARTSGDMPHPVSDTTRRIPPQGAGACDVAIRSVPPVGMASRAFKRRFMRTCSRAVASPKTRGRLLIEGREDVNPLSTELLAREEEQFLHDVRQIDRFVVTLALPAKGEEALGDVAESLGVPVENLQVGERPPGSGAGPAPPGASPRGGTG